MSAWQINGSSAYQNIRRTLTNGGQDFLEFESAAATSATDAEVIAYGTSVTLDKDDVQWFKGTVISNPRLASPLEEKQTIRVAGPMYTLSRCTYMQSWLIYNEAGDANVNVNKSRVILNKGSDGSRITTGAQIEAVIDFAIAKGVPITKGTIDPGTELPFDERTNITCAEAINTMLRYLPDFVLWFDYSTPNPTIHCRKKANLATATKAITDGDLLNLIARKDLQVPGVLLTYEITSTVDDKTRLSILTDGAGTTDAIETVHATFELEGSSRSTIKAKIETAEIPSQGSPNDPSFKDYLRAIVPALKSIADADLTIEAASRTGTKSRYITKGPVPEWVDDSVETDEQVFRISAAIRKNGDPNEAFIDIISSEDYRVSLQTTNKLTNTYTKTTSYDTGEEVPAGLAAQLYDSWNTLHHEGGFDYTLAEIDGLTTPGKLFSLSGGSDHVNGKQSIIQSSTEHLDTGTTSVQFGPPGRLEADTLLGLFRALRARQYSINSSSQNDPEVSSGSAEVTGAAADRTSGSANRNHSYQQIIRTNETDNLEHKLTQDPAAIEFADPAHKAAAEIKPREIVVFVDEAGSVVAKKTQSLISEPYGSPESVGGIEGFWIYRGNTLLGTITLAEAKAGYVNENDWSLEFGVSSNLEAIDLASTPTNPIGTFEDDLFDGNASADPVEAQTFYRIPMRRAGKWICRGGVYRENHILVGSNGPIVELLRIG